MDLDKLDELLAQWEETYKKGLLSFWLLLLLSKRRAYPYEINKAIRELSQNTISADENSIYRALNRLTQSGVVDSQVRALRKRMLMGLYKLKLRQGTYCSGVR